MRKTDWYKPMSFYQIWPRSFCDGNGDGIGDLYGVYEKLDYIKSLNVDGIWFSPLYVSPNADYGYDIADYRHISPDYGDLEIFKKVLDGAHERGLKVIMDLVVNHTSDEHEWFKKACADRNSPYHDYYFFRKAKPNGKLPNNWDSVFEGKAWEYVPSLDEYYLHVFAKKQVDLNMDNPAVREEVKDIMRYWLDMGVDGFREDVITFISKKEGLPDDHLLPFMRGFRFYSDGPHAHEYMAEFKRDVLDKYDCFTVGEAPMMSVKNALKYLKKENGSVLDMMFHFEHMNADCLFTDYIQRPFSLRRLKKTFSRWQYKMNGVAWNTLYIENHDHPRIINRYGDINYRNESGKTLALCYLFQQGTPFVYQGQELGMTNISLPTIDDYIDVMARNEYRKMGKKSEEEKMKVIRRATRDNARTPVQWTGGENAGFTTGKPWFAINPNYPEINAEDEDRDPDSMLNFYRKALLLRKNTPCAVWGTYREYLRRSKTLYVYSREYEGKRLLAVCCFSKKPVSFTFPEGFDPEKGELALSSYPDGGESGRTVTLRPYESRLYIF